MDILFMSLEEDFIIIRLKNSQDMQLPTGIKLKTNVTEKYLDVYGYETRVTNDIIPPRTIDVPCPVLIEKSTKLDRLIKRYEQEITFPTISKEFSRKLGEIFKKHTDFKERFCKLENDKLLFLCSEDMRTSSTGGPCIAHTDACDTKSGDAMNQIPYSSGVYLGQIPNIFVPSCVRSKCPNDFFIDAAVSATRILRCLEESTTEAGPGNHVPSPQKLILKIFEKDVKASAEPEIKKQGVEH